MKQKFLGAALSLMLVSSPVLADEAALAALHNAGVALTSEQAEEVKNASDEQLADVIASIAESIAQQLGQDNAEAQIQSIIHAVAEAKPELVQQVAQAIIDAAPQMEIAVATAAIEAEPTAAGPEQGQMADGDSPSNVPAPAAGFVAAAPPSTGGGGGAVSEN